jgi:poly(hydroxyalkanoate) depolymerase family esterase
MEHCVSLGKNVEFLRKLPKPNGFGGRAEHARSRPDLSPLIEVRGFGSNPGNLKMFAYAPSSMHQQRALVVVLHGCGQTAAGYDLGAGWSTLAKHFGFALLMPEQQPSNNANGCFNWFNPDDTTRERGEACSIRQMIARMVRDHRIDPHCIFVTGLSAGGAMTSVMLATYPEVFAGGAIVAGLPFGAARNVREALFGMHAAPVRSAKILGDRVRGASNHRGPWPKVSVWHGSADRTVDPANAGEIVKQWLDVHDLPPAPMSEGVVDGYPRQVWWNPDGETIVESYTITDMAHGTPLGIADNGKRYGADGPFLIEAGISSSYHIAKFFGVTEWSRRAKKPAAESPSAKLIPMVSPISAVPMPDLARMALPMRKPEATEARSEGKPEAKSDLKPDLKSRPQPKPEAKSEPKREAQRLPIDVSAVINRALIAAGLKK